MEHALTHIGVKKLIPHLKCDYFNPVVKDWTPECQENERKEKLICDYHLYVITPKMKGVFSIAEAVNDAHLLGTKCIFCVTQEDDDREWTPEEIKSLTATSELIKSIGGTVSHDLSEVIDCLNGHFDKSKIKFIK